jgi:hypothetical protein
MASSLTWPDALWAPIAFRPLPTVATETPDQRDRDYYVEAGLVGGEARITVSRQSPDDVGFREVFVSLDGKELAILRHGESVTTEVTPGVHQLRAHNTLFRKTHQVVLKPGEHARFVAANKAGWGTFGMLFILGAMPVYLTFERVPVGQTVRTSP